MFEALSIIRFTDKWKYQYGKGRHQTKVGMLTFSRKVALLMLTPWKLR
jgi:hypothetical protein